MHVNLNLKGGIWLLHFFVYSFEIKRNILIFDGHFFCNIYIFLVILTTFNFGGHFYSIFHFWWSFLRFNGTFNGIFTIAVWDFHNAARLLVTGI